MCPKQVPESGERVGRVGSVTLLIGLAVGACQDHIVVGHIGVSEMGGAGGVAPGPVILPDPTALPEPAMPPAERGLVGQYWDNLDFSGAPTFTRIDTSVELVWSDSPAPGVSNRFSARWQGFLLPPTQGTYQLTLESDDGSRLWLGGELLLDQWQGAPNSTKREVLLDPSQPRELRLELYSLGGSASLRLQWESPSIPLQTVPVENLSVP